MADTELASWGVDGSPHEHARERGNYSVAQRTSSWLVWTQNLWANVTRLNRPPQVRMSRARSLVLAAVALGLILAFTSASALKTQGKMRIKQPVLDGPVIVESWRERYPTIVVGPNDRAATTFEGLHFHDPDAFWAAFKWLNTDVLHSDRRVLVYIGSDQGLGNNYVAMLSAAVLSVVLQRAFRYEWRYGGEIANITQFVDMPFNTYQSLREQAAAAGGDVARQFALDDLHANRACTLNIGTTTDARCVRSLICSDLASSPVNRECAHLAISGNVDVTGYFESNPQVAPLLRFLFGSPTGLTLGRLVPRVLTPSALVASSVARKLKAVHGGFSPSTTLGVHLRTIRVPLGKSVECVLNLHKALGTKHVFVATDSMEARDLLQKALGAQFVSFDTNLNGSVEDPVFRAKTVFTAWEGALAVASCRQKLLSLSWPASSFSHVIYHLSQYDDRVFDLASCSSHPPWRHVQSVPKTKDICDPNDPGNLSDCMGVFNVSAHQRELIF